MEYFLNLAANGSRGGERVIMDVDRRGGRQFIYSGYTDSHDYDSMPKPGERNRPDNRFPTELINTNKDKKKKNLKEE